MVRACAQHIHLLIHRMHTVPVGILLSNGQDGSLDVATVFVVGLLAESVHAYFADGQGRLGLQLDDLRFAEKSVTHCSWQVFAVCCIIAQQESFTQPQVADLLRQLALVHQVDGTGVASGDHLQSDSQLLLHLLCDGAKH